MEDKKALRKKAIIQRNSVCPESISAKSEIIADKLISHPWYMQSNTIFIYVSKDNEVETRQIIKNALDAGKNVCVPRIVRKERMDAVPIKNPAGDLEPGILGIYEPKAHLKPVLAEDIDLVIVPGLVFDRNGYRIGYGGGYYDMFLDNIPQSCKTIGVAFDFQITDKLPIDEFDRQVMLIITDSEMIEAL